MPRVYPLSFCPLTFFSPEPYANKKGAGYSKTNMQKARSREQICKYGIGLTRGLSVVVRKSKVSFGQRKRWRIV